MISVKQAVAVAAMLACSLYAAGAALAADVAAEWGGAYGYEDTNQPVVPFVLTISQNGKIITGHIREEQTFGSRTNDGQLGATIVGSIDGNRISFTKTYDGAGGQRHSIVYKGNLIEGRAILGTWRTGDIMGVWFASVLEE